MEGQGCRSIYATGAILCFIFLILLAAQLFYFALYPLGPDDLRNHVEIPSPGKSAIVDEFNIYGGATSTDVTQVLIRTKNERFDSRKNFILLSVEGVTKIKITWIDDANLDIQYQPGVVYRIAPEWNGIHMIYSEMN